MITTVVGRFPRVAPVSAAASGEGDDPTPWRSAAQREDAYRDAIRRVIRDQEHAGIDVLTDGRLRAADLVSSFTAHLEGFEPGAPARACGNAIEYRRPILRRTPARHQPIFLGDYLLARSCARKPLKVVLPGPYTIVALSEDVYYRSPRPFLRSIAEVLNEEATTLVEAGAVLVQFDEPALGFGRPPMRDVLEAINIAAAGLKAKTAVYTYFGRVGGRLEALHRGACVDVLGVDVLSDPQAVRAVTRIKWKKELALGCVDGRSPRLESIAALHRLFDTVLTRVPRERVYINPNCGLEALAYPQAVAKLCRLAEAVRSYR